MSFRNKTDFFKPAEREDANGNKFSALPKVAASDIYQVGKERVLRVVVGGTDRFVAFGDDKTSLTALTVDAATGFLFEANTIVYVSTGRLKFMKQSAALDSVEEVQDRG